MSSYLFVFSIIFILPYSSKSWDLAIATREEIELVSQEGVLNVTVAAQLHSIRGVTFDSYQGYVYVSDTSHEKYSVFRLRAPSQSDNPSAKLEPVVTKQEHGIQSLAFDPILSILFWTTGGKMRSISWTNIPTPDERGVDTPPVPQAGSILHSFQTEVPHGIVVDSCRRYIFWTNVDYNQPSIDRSDINGANKKRIIGNDIFQPYSITIDILNQVIYWTDEREMEYFRIERANLDGGNRQVIYTGRYQEPTAISIGFNRVYFTDRTNVWAIDLNSANNASLFMNYPKMAPMAVITSDSKYYSYENNSQCFFPTRPKHDSPKAVTEIDEFTRAQTKINKDGTRVVSEEIVGEESTVLLPNGELGNRSACHNNGVWINASCVCKEGYHGSRCELHLACYNYCVRGTCEVDVSGVATCSCPLQFSGPRCEVDMCAGRCQNGGTCIPIDVNQTHCECPSGYFGNHCEGSEFLCRAYCLLKNDVDRFALPETSSCRCEKYHDSMESSQVNIDLDNGTESLTITSHEDTASSSTVSTFILALGTICTLLVVLVMYLSLRIHKLSKRPRIKKRIIVNKTTPLTARPQPDQCEITIENCCNMNICETPCFEPEFRTPIVKGSKSRSEDKRNLLDNIDDPTSGGDFSS
ncbi:hypothetical protein M8J77_012616 [Diaphorina citri]|nr:hypothetical protein M8J77_012616 [Diaphorina citri]